MGEEMKIEMIKYRWPRDLKRCSAEVTDSIKRYRDIAKGAWNVPDDYICSRDARYLIDGKGYCFLHAGGLAIEHLMKEQK